MVGLCEEIYTSHTFIDLHPRPQHLTQCSAHGVFMKVKDTFRQRQLKSCFLIWEDSFLMDQQAHLSFEAQPLTFSHSVRPSLEPHGVSWG